jgi:nucleotide-binding universal stress UspA family protein
MRTILVPLDGSTLAERIMPSVRVLAPLMGARVELLHVVSEADRYHLLADSEGLDEVGGVPLAPSAWEPLRQNAQRYLAELAAALKASGIEAGVDVQFGRPDEAIVEAAERAHVRLIAMATHGYSGIKRWALGSVADKVVHATTTPVLVVRGGAPNAGPRNLRRILVPLDGSALAQRALPLAVELAACARAELFLLGVATPPIIVAPEIMVPVPLYDATVEARLGQMREELGRLARILAQEQLRVTPLAAAGFAAEAIVDQAAQCTADLIVMATHGHSGVRRWALGSVADKVLHATDTPLVLVRAQA